MDAATYARARAAGYAAKDALRLARWIAEDRIETPDYGSPVTIERDGFEVELSLDYDEGMTLADMGYGSFEDGPEDYRSGYQQRPSPEAIPNPRRDSRNPSGARAWYIPGDMGGIEEHAAYHRKQGASKSVALDMARADMDAELRTVTWDYGPSVYVLTATASREGIELATASVGGIEIGWSDLTRTDGREYLAEIADDIIPEAIEEANVSLARLVA